MMPPTHSRTTVAPTTLPAMTPGGTTGPVQTYRQHDSMHHAMFRHEKLTATSLTVIIYDGHEGILRV